MPSFSPFTYLGAFPKPAIQSSVPWLEDLGGIQSNSSIEEYKYSIPIWWLLYKLTLSVEVTMTTPVELSTVRSGTATFDLVFTSNISPTSRFCRTNNIISGTGEAENVTTSGDWDPNPSGGVVDEAYFTMAPFQCEKLHVNFYGAIQGMSSITGEVYLTSSQNLYGFPDGGALGDSENFYSDTLSITTPDGYTVDVYAYMNYYRYINEDGDELANRCSGTVSIKDIEWWTPSG